MTLEELNAARDTATRTALIEGEVIAQVMALAETMVQLDAVGESASHCQKTLAYFINQAHAFLARTAPVAQVDVQPYELPVVE